MKCKYRKKCKWFREDSVTCIKTGGIYYGGNRPAGCYRQMQKEELKNENEKNN